MQHQWALDSWLCEGSFTQRAFFDFDRASIEQHQKALDTICAPPYTCPDDFVQYPEATLSLSEYF